jgi:hypothetical protein
VTMAKQSEESVSSKLDLNRRVVPPRELAPGAMGSVLKLLADQPTLDGVQFISVIKVPDAYTGDFYEYQPVSITVKDGKVVYAQFIGEQAKSINQAINEATQWVDRYFYGIG